MSACAGGVGDGLVKETGQGLLVLEKEALVAGEDVDGLQLVGSGVDDVQEAQRLLDAAGNG